MSLKDVATEVDDLLFIIFKEQQLNASDITDRYAELWSIIKDFVLLSGKRNRPYLLILAFQLYSGNHNHKEVLRIATSQELLHQAFLIHDDIIDKDYVRRGVANVAGKLLEYYQKTAHFSKDKSLHAANSGALLAGDLLIAEAFKQIQLSGLSKNKLDYIYNLTQKSLFISAGGEFADVEASQSIIIETDTISLPSLKTATYSVVTPLIMGAFLADANQSEIDKLKILGDKIGTAFQLHDDELGVFGEESITGKTTIGDLREGKHTYMISQTFKQANKSQLKILKSLFAKSDLNNNEASLIRNVIIESGGREANKKLIKKLYEESLVIIDDLNVDQTGRDILNVFCKRAIDRKL